ncbi:MAG: response regulator [Chloroflexi bacterium]|nr:MAG: response regulator [Chloroflexota bacterium]
MNFIVVQTNLNDTPLILIVDDDALQREVLQVTLEMNGYKTLTTNNGTSALQYAEKHLPDLILLDVRMNGLDGYEVCYRLRENRHTHRIPIIIISGLERDEDQRIAIEAGANDFLSKPFNRMIMLNRIHTLIHLKQMHEALEARDMLLEKALNGRLTNEDYETIAYLLQNTPQLEPPNLSFNR